ncbi:MAG: hypothetical protein WD342_09070 [Verrucomicrobiales bacterium]
MKKRLLRLLVLPALLVSPLTGGDLKVGTGIQDVTPRMGVPLDGSISQNGPVQAIHDPLHVRALVFDDGATKVAVAVVDNTVLSGSLIDEAKTLIEKETGIPGSHVIVAATHSHSTPRGLVGLVDDPLFEEYLGSLPRGIADAVSSAVADLRPAAIGWGSVDVPDHVHNRRWFVEESARIPDPFGEEGETVRMNPGKDGLVKPAGPVDPELFLVSVESTDGRPKAVLGNYGLHYVGGTGRGNVSADYFALFADAIADGLGAGDDFLGIMSNGTSGDVNAIDFSKPREKYELFENMERIADDLAAKALPVVEGIEHRSSVEIAATETVLKIPVRKPDAERLAWAKETAVPPNTPLRLTRPQIYAREALALADYPDVADVRIQAIRIGDLGIVGIPCEVFAETGLAIKAAEIFPATIVMELANGYHGYLPTAEQHEWGGYETWPARSASLEVEAEEQIREASLRLLRELAE